MSNETLAGRIAAASVAVGGKLATDKTNQQQRYDYISADKILAVCGQALAEQGVVVFPSVTNEEITADASASGKPRYDAKVSFVFTVADGTAQMELPFVGRGSDYAVPDKATYKAITSGHKYFLMKLLNIGAGNEDGEHEVQPEVEFQKPTAKQQPAPANGSTPPAAERVEKFQDWAANLHANSKGPATAGQYNWLAGEIDKVTEAGAHNAILEFLVDRPVSSENPIGYDLAKQLLDWLPAKQTKKDGGGPNPNHKPDVVEIVKVIWTELQEAA